MAGFRRILESTGLPFKQFPFYLLLLPLFFIFHGYVEHYPVVSIKTGLLVLLKYIGFTGLILLLSYTFIRSWRSSFLYSFLLLAFHIFFGPIHDVIKQISAGTFISSYSFLVPFFAIIFLVMLILFRKKKPIPRTLAVYFNLLLTAFILIDVFGLSAKITSHKKSAEATIQLQPCSNCNKPDVFLIIADGYAGKIPLREIFKFDNSRFEKEMKSRGFFIVDSSLSNYNYTPFTMASMFSMNYLKNLEGQNKSRADRDICFRHINSNPVIDFFAGHGYTIINHSIFQLNNKLPQIRTRFINVGSDLLTDQTFFFPH